MCPQPTFSTQGFASTRTHDYEYDPRLTLLMGAWGFGLCGPYQLWLFRQLQGAFPGKLATSFFSRVVCNQLLHPLVTVNALFVMSAAAQGRIQQLPEKVGGSAGPTCSLQPVSIPRLLVPSADPPGLCAHGHGRSQLLAACGPPQPLYYPGRYPGERLAPVHARLMWQRFPMSTRPCPSAQMPFMLGCTALWSAYLSSVAQEPVLRLRRSRAEHLRAEGGSEHALEELMAAEGIGLVAAQNLLAERAERRHKRFKQFTSKASTGKSRTAPLSRPGVHRLRGPRWGSAVSCEWPRCTHRELSIRPGRGVPHGPGRASQI